MLLIIIVPLLGVLLYLIFRGHNMHERAAQASRASEEAFRQYIRASAATPADDLQKLDDLRKRGVLTDEEFERAKARTMG